MSAKRKTDWIKEINNIRNLIKQGKTFTEIGKLYNITGHQIGQIAKKYRIEKVDPRIEDKAKLEKMIFEEKLSIREIADIYGCTYQNIAYKIDQYNIEVPKEEKFTQKSLSKELLLDRLEKGKLPKDIAEEFSTSIDVVRNAIRLNNINLSKLKKDIEYKKREKLSNNIKYLISRGVNNQKITQILGINHYVLSKCLEEFNIIPNENGNNTYIESDLRKYLLEEKLSFPEISAKYYNDVDPSAVIRAAKRFGIDTTQHRTNISSGEKIILRFLKENNIDFEFQYRTSSIKGRNSEMVIIDFCLEYNGIMYWIEYNGKQHYEYCKLFHDGDIENFNKQVTRGNNVRSYCKDNDIVLIEIPYSLKSKEVYEILFKVLFSGIDPETLIDYKSLYK